jgi:hypothetical protein
VLDCVRYNTVHLRSDAKVAMPMLGAIPNSSGFAKYIWQARYEAALVETNPVELRTHIEKARDAMSKRLGVLKPRGTVSAMDEYQAIRDAEVMLKILEKRNG